MSEVVAERAWDGMPVSTESVAESLDLYSRANPGRGQDIWAMREGAKVIRQQAAEIERLKAESIQMSPRASESIDDRLRCEPPPEHRGYNWHWLTFGRDEEFWPDDGPFPVQWNDTYGDQSFFYWSDRNDMVSPEGAYERGWRYFGPAILPADADELRADRDMWKARAEKLLAASPHATNEVQNVRWPQP